MRAVLAPASGAQLVEGALVGIDGASAVDGSGRQGVVRDSVDLLHHTTFSSNSGRARCSERARRQSASRRSLIRWLSEACRNIVIVHQSGKDCCGAFHVPSRRDGAARVWA